MKDSTVNAPGDLVDRLFDEVEAVLPFCDRSHIRRRANGLLSKLNALDAESYRDTDGSHVELIDLAQRIMGENISTPLTIAEVSHLCSTSPTMLKQTFRSVVGMPIYQWYRLQRIRRSQELLMHTNLPISHIASAVGYANPSKFSKAFRDEVGSTPRDWRASQE